MIETMKLVMDILEIKMNKTWIKASFHSAGHSRGGPLIPPLNLIEYLDMVGLFETSWMIFDHSKAGSDFGYPDKKSLTFW